MGPSTTTDTWTWAFASGSCVAGSRAVTRNGSQVRPKRVARGGLAVTSRQVTAVRRAPACRTFSSAARSYVTASTGTPSRCVSSAPSR